jgi:hypothetical protein
MSFHSPRSLIDLHTSRAKAVEAACNSLSSGPILVAIDVLACLLGKSMVVHVQPLVVVPAYECKARGVRLGIVGVRSADKMRVGWTRGLGGCVVNAHGCISSLLTHVIAALLGCLLDPFWPALDAATTSHHGRVLPHAAPGEKSAYCGWKSNR